jgi:hypothetical protein
LDDLSFATTEYGYKVFHRHFFETSHAKGPQDAAGGFIKRQADIAVLRGNTIIQNAKADHNNKVRVLANTDQI